jgi:hypothetical protein
MIITIPGIVITMIPESLLRSFRNAHHDHFGIAITLLRNPHSAERSPCGSDANHEYCKEGKSKQADASAIVSMSEGSLASQTGGSSKQHAVGTPGPAVHPHYRRSV